MSNYKELINSASYCPFCGCSEVKIQHTPITKHNCIGIYVECVECKAHVQPIWVRDDEPQYEDYVEAMILWNTRYEDFEGD